VLPHLQRVLLQKPVLLELYLLQRLHLLRNLLLQLLLQRDYHTAAVVQQVCQLVVLGQQELVLLHQRVEASEPRGLQHPLLLHRPQQLLVPGLRRASQPLIGELLLVGNERVAQLRFLDCGLRTSESLYGYSRKGERFVFSRLGL
jgi:hypothetical protein